MKPLKINQASGRVKMPSFPILNLTPEAFSKYGRILEPTTEEVKTKRSFIILEKVTSDGWRMAHSKVTQKYCDNLRCHLNTKETFDPLHGIVALVVAPHDHPDDAEVFLLDKPVVVYEGVWHANITLSETAYLRINENLNVVSESHKLPFIIKAEMYAVKI
jgi:ureidoglycolate hydrolase